MSRIEEKGIPDDVRSYEIDNKVISAVPSPVVSVQTITYQHEPYIRQCIEGVLMQKTDFPIEYIIGEDCSSDGTREIVMEYADRFPGLIRVITADTNVGMVENGKRCMRACRGKYIALCEGDDYWTDPLKLQKQVELLERDRSLAGCFHETPVIFEESGKIGRVFGADAPLRVSVKDTFSRISLFHTSSFVFRRYAFVFPEWFSEIISGDMAIFSIVAASGDLLKISEKMSVYRQNAAGITNTDRVREGYHKDRIFLIECLDQFHCGRFSEKAEEVVEFHKGEIEKDAKRKREELFMRKKIYKKERSLEAGDQAFVDIRLTHSHVDLYGQRVGILNALKSALPGFKGEILDIGCGKMPYKSTILQSAEVTSYTGLDIEGALVYSEELAPDFRWDGKRMPFADGQFDCAMATEVLEHCPDPELVLRESFRVLRPGGVLFLTVPFLWNLHEVPHDEYRYTPFSLERHLKNAGFVGVEINALGGWHASLAQMIGLWVRRAPLREWKRKLLSRLAVPIVRVLLKKDKETNISFREGQMITGLSAIARK